VVEPYFDRNYQHFSSHAQTPPRKQASRYAAAIRSGRIITIPFPIFQAFGTHGNLPYRQLVGHCLDLLLPEPLVRVQTPSTTEVTVMRQKARTVVHFLQFVAERRGTIDMIEDVVPLRDVPVSLKVGKAPRRVYLAPSGAALSFHIARGRLHTLVPVIDGHQMLVVE